MGKLFGILVLIFFLTSCNQSSELFHGKNVSMHSSNLIEKSGAPLLLRKPEQVQSISTNMYSFVTVNEWYNDEEILYLTDENGISYVYKFHILTGEEEVFFQINEPILRIDANPSNSLFAIEVATINGQKELYFVNKNGEVLYRLNDFGDEIQLYWNQFKENELIFASLLEDYTMKLMYLNVNSQKLSEINFEHFYVQWMGEEELAYLKWDMFSLSYYAPLFTYHLKNNEEKKLADDIITFFSYDNAFITISIEDRESLYSNYTFYHAKTKTKVATLQVPILNTYSEQWWIPNHAYHGKSKTFFFINPNNSGDLYDYSDGYTLVSLQLDTGKTKEISPIDGNYPIKLSPSGRWLLYGYQLENIIDIKNKEIHSLLYW